MKDIVKIVANGESSSCKKDHGFAKTVEPIDKDCDHNWEELGTLVFYEKNMPTMPPKDHCYSGYLKTDSLISVLKCKQCREVRLQWNPWKVILGEEKNV